MSDLYISSSISVNKKDGFKPLSKILSNFDAQKDKYISREWQQFGVMLSTEFDDVRHKALYIRMARDYPRAILEQARRFVSDAQARSKGRLFMWKVKDLMLAAKKTSSQ